MRNRIDIADVRQELVAETLALRSARHESRDVDELHGRGHDLLRMHDVRELLQARIRHRHDTHVGVDRAERIVLSRDLRSGEGVEQCRLADVRQTDDAAANWHGSLHSGAAAALEA